MNDRSFVYVSSQRPSYVCVNPLTLELIPEGRGVRIRLPQWKIDELVPDLSSSDTEVDEKEEDPSDLDPAYIITTR